MEASLDHGKLAIVTARCSANITVGRLVFARMITGKIEASQT